MLKRLALAFQFLTILPVKVRGDVSEQEMAGADAFFPLVGAFQGLVAVLFAALFARMFSPEIASGLALAALIITNGGFHLDGLADTVDALSVKSSGDERTDLHRRLSVMKDSATGAIGVVAIVITLALKFLFLDFLLVRFPLLTACSLLFLMPVFSKWILVPAMYHGTPARPDGLGRLFITNTRATSLLSSSALLLPFCALTIGVHLHKAYNVRAALLPLIMIGLLYTFGLLFSGFCARRFGGQTGDTFGALSELSEILFLAAAALWLQHFI